MTAPRVLHLGAWLVAGPLAAVLVLRLAAWDASAILVALDAGMPWLAFPLTVVLFVAVALRRWPLAGVALLELVVVALLALPELTATTRLPAAARTAPRLLVFDAEVKAGSAHPAAYARAMRESGADVAVLQQAPPGFVDEVRRASGTGRFPYATDLSHLERLGPLVQSSLVVLSRYPLRDARATTPDDHPTLLTVDVETPHGVVHVVDVHTRSAVVSSGGLATDLRLLRAAVAHRGGATLVAGDFNATWGNRGFRQVLDLGLVDAAAARGHATQYTWPADAGPVPPMLRIDHVLTRGPLAVTDIRALTMPGSDHRALVATVALLPG